MTDIKQLKDDLRELLSNHRYQHCLRVADEAKRLAKRYGCDLEKAYVAGLVHDVAKEFSMKENQDLIEKHHLPKSFLLDGYRKVLHAYLGEVYLRDNYTLDEDILEAVRFHATGDQAMNQLDKIIFLADKIEIGKDYPGIEEERRVAYQDLDQAMILCLENNLRKLEKEHKKINRKSIEVLEFLCGKQAIN